MIETIGIVGIKYLIIPKKMNGNAAVDGLMLGRRIFGAILAAIGGLFTLMNYGVV